MTNETLCMESVMANAASDWMDSSSCQPYSVNLITASIQDSNDTKVGSWWWFRVNSRVFIQAEMLASSLVHCCKWASIFGAPV